MKNVIGTTIFCVSFITVVFAAESPEQSPFITRGIGLGNTGGAARPNRASSSSSGSLKRAETIRVTLPRRTSNEEGKRILQKSPRSELEFNAIRSKHVDLPTEPFDFSKAPQPKVTPSYAEKK